jgi:hypothetical protein
MAFSYWKGKKISAATVSSADAVSWQATAKMLLLLLLTRYYMAKDLCPKAQHFCQV